MASPTSPPASPAAPTWKQRLHMEPERKAQFRNFLVATTAMLGSIMVTRRAIGLRSYRPTMFVHNTTPPPFNKYQDGAQAMAVSLLLSGSGFAMAVTGVSLLCRVNNVHEFGAMMRRTLGGDVRQREREKEGVPPEIAELEQKIEDFLTYGLRDDPPEGDEPSK
ncbi:uncharacterized protein V1510DRAFT_400236 [Dipodascopsis tothii]|uniref:uncharacterized protein n=1 Tax=Dipodascopsis tothii TaxID=44089 RepID=UPI0034CF2643